jgi:flavin reductase (DIM6/NTAB) family NADH-FMN oxidoreductase RutF
MRKIAAGDHSLYVAEVVQGGVTSEGRPYTHLRRSGMGY